MTSPMTVLVARVLAGPVFMLAIATLIGGYKDVGDGFAAGLIAALAVLLQYFALGPDAARALLPVRFAPQFALVGVAGILTIALIPLWLGDPILRHYPGVGSDPAYVGSIEVATPLAFDAMIFVLVLGAVVAVFDALVGVVDVEEERS